MADAEPELSPYPAAMYRWPHPPVEVIAEEFISQEDATRELNCTTLSVGRMIAEGRLRPATSVGRAGVTRVSLVGELARRQKPLWRARAFVRSLLHWLTG